MAMSDERANATASRPGADPALLRLVLFVVVAALIATAIAAGVAGARWLAGGGGGAGGGAVPVEVIYDDMPAFELTNQLDEPIAAADLAGRPWVASFVFTRCRGTCPMISAHKSELARLLAELGVADEVRLVSFSVDPGHDTPAVLAEYGQRFGAEPERWLMLTGEREELWRLVRDGFRLGVYEQDDPDMPIAHSSQFVLIDGRSRIRGYYDALDEHGRAELLEDLRWLLAENE